MQVQLGSFSSCFLPVARGTCELRAYAPVVSAPLAGHVERPTRDGLSSSLPQSGARACNSIACASSHLRRAYQPAKLSGSSSCHGLASAHAKRGPEPQGDPAILRLPENYKVTAGANQRVAATSAASAAVAAEQADFTASAAHIKCAHAV